MTRLPKLLLISAALAFSGCGVATAQEDAPTAEAPATAMTGEALGDYIVALDGDAQRSDNAVIFTLEEREMMLVFDTKADRMRLVAPIAPSAVLDEALLLRMAQANYDAVLDARYAVANDLVWSVFIHPLSSLDMDEFKSAVAQTYFAAETFGTAYTSGAIVFGGGDSSEIHKDLIEKLEEAQKKRERI